MMIASRLLEEVGELLAHAAGALLLADLGLLPLLLGELGGLGGIASEEGALLQRVALDEGVLADASVHLAVQLCEGRRRA